MEIAIETLKLLLPGMFDLGGTQPTPKTVYLLTLGVRLYCSTDYNELHRFGLKYRHPFIDMLPDPVYHDISLRLLAEDFRDIRI
jgi:hypothetical protein